MQLYVLGFLFNSERDQVLLIKKEKPLWQVGLLNGIGGKIEPGETASEAMHREAMEEADVDEQWKLFCEMEGATFHVSCFYGIYAHYGLYNAFKQKECEILQVADTTLIQTGHSKYKTISNLPWLISMALDVNHGEPRVLHVRYGERRY